MKLIHFLRSSTMGALLANIGIAVAALFLFVICFFYIYLPGATNHGESITVPDLTGMKLEELDAFLFEHELRFEPGDSMYLEGYQPLTILRQFPKGGASVKANRMIYVSINQVLPPTVPMPDLVEGSRINAESVLTSNQLKTGKIVRTSSPYFDMVMEMRYKGRKTQAGERVPKESVIDLIVGDGLGPSDPVLSY